MVSARAKLVRQFTFLLIACWIAVANNAINLIILVIYFNYIGINYQRPLTNNNIARILS